MAVSSAVFDPMITNRPNPVGMGGRGASASIAYVLSLLAVGCLHQRVHTDSDRSATEQLLIAEAAERAVASAETSAPAVRHC